MRGGAWYVECLACSCATNHALRITYRQQAKCTGSFVANVAVAVEPPAQEIRHQDADVVSPKKTGAAGARGRTVSTQTAPPPPHEYAVGFLDLILGWVAGRFVVSGTT